MEALYERLESANINIIESGRVFEEEKVKEYDEKKKIDELGIPRMKQEHICKLLDVLPSDAEDVKLTLNSYSVTLTNENAAKIADVIKTNKK